MSINIFNYPDYINPISFDTSAMTNPLKKTGSADPDASCDFEMAFQSMLSRSQDAYQIILDKAEDGPLSLEGADDAQEAVLNPGKLLETYEAMQSGSRFKSIQETMLETLNGEEQAYDDSHSGYRPDFSMDEIVNMIKKLL